MTDLATATPAEIDSVLFPLWAQRWGCSEEIYTTRRRIAASLFPGSIVEYRYGGGRQAVSAYYGTSDGNYRGIAETLAKAAAGVERIVELLAETEAEITPIDAEFERRGGWTRYLLVRDGHLHKRYCSTLRPTTATYLLAEASGLSDAEVVAKYNYVACTKCFPDAPVHVAPAAKPGNCASSGTHNVKEARPGSLNLYRPFGTCKECGAQVSVTSTGKLRQHKAAQA